MLLDGILCRVACFGGSVAGEKAKTGRFILKKYFHLFKHVVHIFVSGSRVSVVVSTWPLCSSVPCRAMLP
jgi:hypothetical protein